MGWARLLCAQKQISAVGGRKGEENEGRKWRLVFGGFDLECKGSETRLQPEGSIRVKERCQERVNVHTFSR